MHYVSAKNIGKSYGIKPLFNQIDLHVNEGDCIALVAKNGSGKSTLLKILAGIETPDEGAVWKHKDLNVVFFDQDPELSEHATIIDNLLAHEHPLINALRQYEESQLSGDPEQINAATQQMEELRAWDTEAKIKQVLQRLNIQNLHQQVSTLSGGQRKRLALAKTLVDIGFDDQHTLLIMDEPTNHLDIEMVEWLEDYLNRERLTLILVSHDRYFLDGICDQIWELEDKVIHFHQGNYEQFLERKAARIESELATIDKARNRYRKELEWMRKQPRARTTKSKNRQERFYDVEKVAKQRKEETKLALEMKMSRMGGKVVELKKIYKSYGDRILLKGFDYTFKKGEKVGIIGKNGAGKTTFVNILQGQELPDSGKVNIGDTIIFGHFSQKGLEWKTDMRVIEYVKNIAESFELAKGGSLSAAQFLERFLFTPDQQYSYISKLSGGEKKRLHLLSVLFKNPNFLVLDEPTNDLDLPTLSVLEEFLEEFQGCIVIISHDRYFMDRIVDHLLVFEGEGVIRDFPGNYADYRIEKEASMQQKQTSSKPSAGAEKKKESSDNGGNEPLKRKPGYKEKREFELLTTDLKQLAIEKESIANRLSSGVSDYKDAEALSKRFQELSTEIDTKELRWLELSELFE
jgi:ATP-binding cassette subfamily F protein uup